jgi:hypothetical protein
MSMAGATPIRSQLDMAQQEVLGPGSLESAGEAGVGAGL